MLNSMEVPCISHLWVPWTPLIQTLAYQSPRPKLKGHTWKVRQCNSTPRPACAGRGQVIALGLDIILLHIEIVHLTSQSDVM